ncbi:MAG: response regulator transcription factor [Clostridium argentinense]|uniref:LytR/AlgR family response regulator transcription factor n=1 Tax=Clostridium butanoliproducens TaxID=2991837 RepID=UPI001D5E950B|nr:LytTR family DNA-binding domain-containing protein [Clostridium butanoliproducens]MBS5822586.1 response regulator transcription factor [Clostridium argentinense]
MLNVIICEDNSRQRKQIKNTVENSIVSNSLNLNIALCTDSPKKVLNYLKENRNSVGVYFLDIDLGSDVNGLILAKNIRKYDPDGYIIFITVHSELSYMTFEYKVEAMGFIPKDDMLLLSNKIKDNLLTAYNRYMNKAENDDENKNNFIMIESGYHKINVSYENILFFETIPATHKIRVHTFKGQIEFYGSIKELKDKLNDDFYHSHRSYLVNIKNIKEIDKKRLLICMKNDEECYVSIRRLRGLIEKWSV